MELIFVSDFFINEVKGGAEIVDDHLINFLSKKQINVTKIKSQNLTESLVKENSHKTFFVSNFTGINQRTLSVLSACKYFIFEHDHKYTIDRDVSKYKDYVVPPNRLINLSFYKNAQAVFCQSKIHCEVVKKNVKTNNIVNLECSIWSDNELNTLEK